MGWLKAALGVGVLAGTFYAGRYHANANRRFEEHEQAGQRYLREIATGRTKTITPDFELGTLDERIAGAVRESKTDVGRLFQLLGKEFNNNYQPR